MGGPALRIRVRIAHAEEQAATLTWRGGVTHTQREREGERGRGNAAAVGARESPSARTQPHSVLWKLEINVKRMPYALEIIRVPACINDDWEGAIK